MPRMRNTPTYVNINVISLYRSLLQSDSAYDLKGFVGAIWTELAQVEFEVARLLTSNDLFLDGSGRQSGLAGRYLEIALS
jgi:hypothetical protein